MKYETTMLSPHASRKKVRPPGATKEDEERLEHLTPAERSHLRFYADKLRRANAGLAECERLMQELNEQAAQR